MMDRERIATSGDAKSLMVLGTGSHAGKSLIVTALCRYFASRGVRVAPFKAQNMSLNSAATPDGLEIGRAQALQAEAAGIAPTADMNPILIKPSGDTSAQLIVHGRIAGNVAAGSYFREQRGRLLDRVLESYERLAEAYELLVIEGAGSPAEMNLREHDIVNLGLARAVDAPCLLIGDIDRGGVFASLLGTLELLEPEDRACIRAFAINKFRGDLTLLEPGITEIERRLRIPCAGVIPFIPQVELDEEDGISVEGRIAKTPGSWRASARKNGQLRIAVLAFPFISNFTDFDPLFTEPAVEIRFTRFPEDVRDADLIILPGTKQTLHDLRWLHETGLAPAVLETAARACIFGICGGMQMLGNSVDDPACVEGGGKLEGLGLLPITTTLATTKTTVQTRGRLASSEMFDRRANGTDFHGYEIHVGQTIYAEDTTPFSYLTRNGTTNDAASSTIGNGDTVVRDGAVSDDGRVMGTYVHGIFDDDAFRHAFLDAIRRKHGMPQASETMLYTAQRQARLDRVARIVGEALDLQGTFPHLRPFYR